MFKNVGKTLKTIAKIWNVIAVLEIIAGVTAELVLGFSFYGAFIGGGLAAAGFSFIAAVCFYAFGQITEDVHRMSGAVTDVKSEDDEIPEI